MKTTSHFLPEVNMLPDKNVVVQSDVNGDWYAPVDPKDMLPTKRYVSAALTKAQAQQLIQAFFLFTIERAELQATRLIMFRYLCERGYTVRWMGKYVQAGNNVGNGNTFRNFRRLHQYNPERLPIHVLEKLMTGRFYGSWFQRDTFQTEN